MTSKLTLAEARRGGRINQFVAEREAEAALTGDSAKVEGAIASMARTSKVARTASTKVSRAD